MIGDLIRKERFGHTHWGEGPTIPDARLEREAASLGTPRIDGTDVGKQRQKECR